MYCLCANEPVPYESFMATSDTKSLIQNIPDDKALPVLWFATSLVEEVGKTDSNSMKQSVSLSRMPILADIILGTNFMRDWSQILKMS